MERLGRADEAIACYRQAIRLHPNFAEAHFNLGNALKASGKKNEAITSYLLAIKHRPTYVEALCNLGATHQASGNLKSAIDYYQRALAHAPTLANLHHNLAGAYSDLGEFRSAIPHFREAIRLRSNYPQAWNGLATALMNLGETDEAISCHRQAITLKPDFALAHYNLGISLGKLGNCTGEIECYRETLRLQPDFAIAHSNLLCALQYAFVDPHEKFFEHQKFGQQVESPLKKLWRPHRNPRDPERLLKIGYVSGDLRDHAVAYFIEPILDHHDKTRFEVFCYHNHRVHDAVSDRLARLANHWRSCHDWADDQLADQIRTDEIDILIDLSGHTAFNRLLVFARKPAPVQMTWIGYPDTTGLTAIDYRLTESGHDPVGVNEELHTERLLRLPNCTTFRPAPDCPDVGPLPALSSPYFTLACLNNPIKINERVVKLWACILHAIPNARLMLGNATTDDLGRDPYRLFDAEGIAASRLIPLARMPIDEYLKRHQQIDLALDPFPYNGGTTSCHSLWMGVPLVTLAGRTTAGRYGAALMAEFGLDEFIACSEADYVDRVITIARNLNRLDEVRQSLRKRIRESLNRNPERLTRDLEDAFRNAWRHWCKTGVESSK